MVANYLQAIGFVMFTLLIIALTIDLSDNMDRIQQRAAERETGVMQLLLPYLGFRAIDIVTRLLGMATLIGAGVATLLRFQRLEDVILSAAGAPPTLVLSALMMVGIVTGTVQWTFQNWLRPPAVATQVSLNLGNYGRWFAHTELGGRWFVSDGLAMRAEVTRGANPELRNLQIFAGVDDPTLSRIVFAERADQNTLGNEWVLHGVTLWENDEQSTGNATQTSEKMRMVLPLNIEGLRWLDVNGYYIPNKHLRRIAQLDGTRVADDARTTLAFRNMAFFLPGIFALLGASLAMAGRRARRLAPFRLLILATVGYVTLVSVRVFWALGIHGRISPYVAAMLPLAIALAMSTYLQLRQAGYLRRR
ncbi:lipopolysaccharide export LptBFGC system permease protein LptF [Shimia abyssi]|uniref:Lipopolysaccharide export LptBFGC system permease protein LptF n=2 Tax=Shimia abyssi TaxID=1662395 RepID=A0A2P8FAI3_9RHOB|nr:lipopolysaccharide export LptBFGC system permease protein LptF [Shimia abyssi]